MLDKSDDMLVEEMDRTKTLIENLKPSYSKLAKIAVKQQKAIKNF